MKRLVLLFLMGMICLTGFTQESFDVQFSHDGKIMFGTFSRPSGSGRFPTIIINPGSGPQDRNGTLTLADSTSECLYPGLINETLEPYKQLAEALVDSGFAVLRYDKIEYTYSPAQLGTITFHKLWLPVESAIDFVKTRDDVDTNCMMLVGHSEGSSLIPFIALERSDIKALVSIAGPRTPFDSILAYQIVNIAQTCDDDVLAAEYAANQVLDYFHSVRVNHGIGLPAAFGVPARAWYDYLLAIDSVALNYNLNDLPTLFIGLGEDINVPPSELERFKKDVTITDDFWSLPGIVHYMTPTNDPDISSVLTDTLIYWLKQQCLPTSIAQEKQKNNICIYPNPFDSEIYVSFPMSNIVKMKYKIFDISGSYLRVVDSDQSAGSISKINLSHLPAGAYILQVELDGMNEEHIIFKK